MDTIQIDIVHQTGDGNTRQFGMGQQWHTCTGHTAGQGASHLDQKVRMHYPECRRQAPSRVIWIAKPRVCFWCCLNVCKADFGLTYSYPSGIQNEITRQQPQAAYNLSRYLRALHRTCFYIFFYIEMIVGRFSHEAALY